jgi:hypothetical protein
MEKAMRLTSWLVVLISDYVEYATWRGRNVYRRTVSYDIGWVVLIGSAGAAAGGQVTNTA